MISTRDSQTASLSGDLYRTRELFRILGAGFAQPAK